VSSIAIRIITDSTCDLSREDQERLGIQVVPLTVHFSGESETYMDGIDITNEQFYEKLEHCKLLPKTSQVPPDTFIETFGKCVEAGDEVVGIFISSEISGTYHSACIAKNTLGSDRVHVIDSRSATMSLALLVSEAAKHRDAGHTAAEIAGHIAELSKKIRFIAAVNTLKYLRKGGRVSAATVVIGEALGMKPIIAVIDGAVQSIGKARGMQAALKAMLQHVLVNLPDLRYDVAFAHACAPELLEKAISCLKEPLELTHWLVCSIGSVIGTYSGKGAVGFAYIGK